MKILTSCLPPSCWSLLSLLCLFSCQPESPETQPGPDTSTPTVTQAEVDTWSEHLQCWGGTKKPGKAPVALAGSSTLKRSIKDTLYLMQGVKLPIKFLHLDTTQNVAGIFVQVQGASASTGGILEATHYYAVPEQKQTNRSDTVSIILLGFDPTGLPLPLTFGVTITPYDENGKTLDVTTLPVKVEELNDDINKEGSCGITLPEGKKWQWSHSYIANDQPASPTDHLHFYSDPYLVFSPEGQWIAGSCCNGYSEYGKCKGAHDFNARLHFATYYQIEGEYFLFESNGKYARHTFEKTVVPLPIESNFCGNGPGKVRENNKYVFYEGNWTQEPTSIPPDLKNLVGYNSRNSLTLQGTYSSDLGFGNPGGIIHQLNCISGYLVLIQLDEKAGAGTFLKYIYPLQQKLPYGISSQNSETNRVSWAIRHYINTG